MDLDELTMQAKKWLPGAEVVRVEENYRGRAPFNLVVCGNGQWAHQPFGVNDCMLACKIIAGRLKLGVKP